MAVCRGEDVLQRMRSDESTLKIAREVGYDG